LTEEPTTFGALLAYYRANVRKLSQEKLAEETGIPARLIRRYEKDEYLPGLENYALIVKALQIPADYLIPNTFPGDGRRHERRVTTNG
jgi:transcriptional regulator with XRE-family HTH domain